MAVIARGRARQTSIAPNLYKTRPSIAITLCGCGATRFLVVVAMIAFLAVARDLKSSSFAFRFIMPKRITPAPKYMVYYSVGGDTLEYTRLLNYSLTTLRSFPENDEIDIYVLTDTRFAKATKEMAPRAVTTVVKELDPARCQDSIGRLPCLHVLSSMRKTEIFDVVIGIEKYAAAVFFDAATIICGPLQPIFAAVAQDASKLYVKRDEYAPGNLTAAHNMDYTKEELHLVETSKVKVFNAGLFAFSPTPAMRRHFEAINDRILNHAGEEQSHMNRYFNPKILTNTSFLEKLVAFNTFSGGNLVVHVPNTSLTWHMKLDKLKLAWAGVLNATMPIKHPSRYMMHTVLNATSILEIGVFQGNFSSYLLQNFKPQTLWLVDPWHDHTIASGNADGDFSSSFNGVDLFNNVTARFANRSEVHVIRKDSAVLRDPYLFDARSMDLVYVDGDHSYEGVARDLLSATRIVEPGNWVAGHDFRCKGQGHDFSIGVTRAVDEFCVEYGVRIWHIFQDGCASFAVRL